MIPIVIYILISILLGAVSCLFGKKLYFPVLMLTVFSAVVTISLSLFEATLEVSVITTIIGIIAALLSRFLYKLGVFLLGGILGAGLSMLIISILPSDAAEFGWIIALTLVAAAGICAVKWFGFFIMITTSFNGAFTIAVPLCFLFKQFHNLHNFIYADGMLPTIINFNQYLNNQFLEENGTLIFVLTFLIALGGFSFQRSQERKK